MSKQKKALLTGLELTADVIFSTEAAERQTNRRENGLDLAAALLDGPLEWMQTDDGPAVLNLETGELVDDRSAAFAALLAFAADESNQVAGILDDGKGGTFHAGAALWKPSLRLDPNWMETMRRRSRGRAHEAMKRMMDGLTPDERAARKYGWRQRLTLKLITLTMPHHAGTSSLEETRRLNRALELLKKRTWWRGVMAGGIKGVEDALDYDGPHVHAHMLMLSRFVERNELIEEWRICLDEATRNAYGFGLAESCAPFVDVRQVKKKESKAGDTISWDDALSEVTKYVTKPADFLKPNLAGQRISREVLLEICEVRRWPRMFELLGRCRDALKKARPSDLAAAAQAALDSIHRAYLTGEVPKIPEGMGWELVEGWDTELDGPEEKRKLIVLGLQARDRDGPKRVRPPTWRDLLDQISLPEWLTIMAERFRRGKMFRIRQLLDMNPSAYLVTMNGHAFGCAPE
jgi:hypothetical protein